MRHLLQKGQYLQVSHLMWDLMFNQGNISHYRAMLSGKKTSSFAHSVFFDATNEGRQLQNCSISTHWFVSVQFELWVTLPLWSGPTHGVSTFCCFFVVCPLLCLEPLVIPLWEKLIKGKIQVVVGMKTKTLLHFIRRIEPDSYYMLKLILMLTFENF